MAAGFYYNDAGTWRTLTGVYYNDAGTWRTLSEVWYNDAGTWRQVFGGGGGGAATISLPSSLGVSSGTGLPASMTLLSNGAMETLEDGVTTDSPVYWLSSWPDAATAANYSVRRTQISGAGGVSFTGTMASGTWYPLSSARGVTVVSSAGVARHNESTWDIALTSNLTSILATMDLVITADP